MTCGFYVDHVVQVPTAYDKIGFSDVFDVEVHEYSKPPEEGKGFMADFTAYFKKQGAPVENECLDKLVQSIVENFNLSVGGTPYFINLVPPCTYNKKAPCKTCPEGTTDESPMTPGKNCKK